jgi:uncharacterized oligopeptide transporter (OPT) family protein
VLIVGSAEGSGSDENKRGLATILVNALLSAGVSLLISMKLVAGEIARYFKIGAGATGASTSLSLALVGVGHLVGLSVGLAMLLGMAISWLGLVPYFSQGVAGADASEIAGTVFREKPALSAQVLSVSPPYGPCLRSSARLCRALKVQWPPLPRGRRVIAWL